MALCIKLPACVLVCVSLLPPVPAQDILRDSDSFEHGESLARVLLEGDEELLTAIQRGGHNYFWNEVGQAKIARDRKKAPVSSIASVGFQLSALPIAVERQWIDRSAGQARAQEILKHLVARTDNKRFGLYYHYLDLDSAAVSDSGYEVLVSTVDTAILFAGAIVAGEYFGGETKQLARTMLRDADWSVFATGPDGQLSMGWRPNKKDVPTGRGKFHPHHWQNASDEERLIYFIACGAPAGHDIAPELYYRLKRVVKQHAALEPFVVSPQGTLFQHFFSHCWIDYGSLQADDPAKFAIAGPRVDWSENSRRAMLTHRRRCIEMSPEFKTLSADTWGLSACVSRDGYLVPQVQPNLSNRDNWGQGTLATYAAASAIMFTPKESLAALRAFGSLKVSGSPVLIAPESGGYGLVDSYNLDQGWICNDWVGIDVGPTIVAIENARTGLVWRLFMQSEVAERAIARLGLTSISHAH